MTMGIYKIYNANEGKYYIGQSTNIENRIRTHINSLKKCKHENRRLQRAFNKYGIEKFEFSILKEVNDPSLLDYYESYYAEKYNAVNEGYNIQSLYSSKDIKYILDNINSLTKKWKSILEEITNKHKENKWYATIDKEVLCDKLNLDINKVSIFIKYFNDYEYRCDININGKVNIIYISQKYIDKTIEQFYL